jgi:hypothetical protein
VGPGAGLDKCGISRPTGIPSPDLTARSESLYRLRYPGSHKVVLVVNNVLLITDLFYPPTSVTVSSFTGSPTNDNGSECLCYDLVFIITKIDFATLRIAVEGGGDMFTSKSKSCDLI